MDEGTGAMLVEVKGGDASDTEEEAEALWAPLRAALERDGSVQQADGSEILSTEEVERRLQAGGVEGDDVAAWTAAMEEEEGEEEDEEEVEAEDEVTDVGAAEPPPPLPAIRSSTSPTRPRRAASSNTLWVQERGDGSVAVVPWPFDQSDAAATTADSAYDLNMPSSSPSSPHDVIGSSVGGEKVRVADVSVLLERDVQEHFSKGGGRGGQKVNKSSNCVHLHHVPTGTIVKCHATRSLAENRKIARRILQSRLEELLLGPNSTNRQRQLKIQKSKAKNRRRSRAKYGDNGAAEGDIAAELSAPATATPGAPPSTSATSPPAATPAKPTTATRVTRLSVGET